MTNSATIKLREACSALHALACAVSALMDVYGAGDEERYKSLNRIYGFSARFSSMSYLDECLCEDASAFADNERALMCWRRLEDYSLEAAITAMLEVLLVIPQICMDICTERAESK